MRTTKLPLPRLQLRWEKNPDYQTGKPGSDYEWRCHYELVIPLDKYDVRRDVYKNGRLLKRKLPHLVVPIKPPQLRGSDQEPCRALDGTRHCDTPFRDGVHAKKWDAKVLGNQPIYVIAPDGMVFDLRLKNSAATSTNQL
jgi:hypothetical protein